MSIKGKGFLKGKPISFDLPQGWNLLAMAEPKDAPALSDVGARVRELLVDPIGMPPLAEVVAGDVGDQRGAGAPQRQAAAQDAAHHLAQEDLGHVAAVSPDRDHRDSHLEVRVAIHRVLHAHPHRAQDLAVGQPGPAMDERVDPQLEPPHPVAVGVLVHPVARVNHVDAGLKLIGLDGLCQRRSGKIEMERLGQGVRVRGRVCGQRHPLSAALPPVDPRDRLAALWDHA